MNLGLTGNLNRAVELASGDLLVEQDGDDFSLPVRASRLLQAWNNTQPKSDLVFSDATRISVDGAILKRQVKPLPIVTLEELIRGTFFIAGGCVSAYSRSLFEKFGPVDPAIKYTDYALTFRALLGSGCTYVDEPLVYYRVHDESITQSELSLRIRRAHWRHGGQNAIPEAEDGLRAYDVSQKGKPHLRWRIARNLAYTKLDARSSMGSPLVAFGCFIWAIGTGRLKTAWKFLWRDVLARH